MSKFETPIDFEIEKVMDNVVIKYSDINEISQGGPEVGRISINGIQITSDLFGGPVLLKNEYLFAPIFIKKFFGYGFKLSKINTTTLDVELIGHYKDLIFLDKILDNEIFFYEDLNKTLVSSYRL